MLNRIIPSQNQIKKMEAIFSLLKESIVQVNKLNILKGFEEIGDEFSFAAKEDTNSYWQEALAYAFIFYQGSLFISQDNKWNQNIIFKNINDDRVITKIKNLEKHLLFKIHSHDVKASPWLIDLEHRNRLSKLRIGIAEEIKRITVIIPSNDKDLLTRSKILKNIYKQAELSIKKFISELVDECIECLGLPPCEYSIIGFGSLSDQSWTPYSDFEFGVLLQEGLDSEGNRQYFRNLIQLLQVKIINLGETPIPFNLFNYSFDNLIGMGFCFDLGGKTPLGRRYETTGLNNGELKYELIGEPINLIRYLDNCYFTIDRLLPVVVLQSTHIAGQHELTKRYHSLIEKKLHQKDVNGKLFQQNRAIELMLGNKYLDGDLNTHYLATNFLEAISYDVKKQVYRPLVALITHLALFYDISSGSVRKKIKMLSTNGILNTLDSNNLKILNGIAQELRLRIYDYFQKEKNSFSLSNITGVENSYLLKERELLEHFYSIYSSFHSELKFFFANQLKSTERPSIRLAKINYGYGNFKNKVVARRIFGFFDIQTLKTVGCVSKNLNILQNLVTQDNRQQFH